MTSFAKCGTLTLGPNSLIENPKARDTKGEGMKQNVKGIASRLRRMVLCCKLDLEFLLNSIHLLAEQVVSIYRNGLFLVKAAGKWAIGRTLMDAVFSLVCHLVTCI